MPNVLAILGITSVFAMAQQFDTTPDRVNQLGQRYVCMLGLAFLGVSYKTVCSWAIFLIGELLVSCANSNPFTPVT